MRRILLLLALAASFALPARADAPAPDVQIVHPWARATPTGARTGAVYLTLVNKGAVPDRLIGVSSAVAAHAQVHEESMENGVMKMRPVGDLALKPGGQTVLEPGKMHVMLMSLRTPLKEGTHFQMTLEFAKSGKKEIDVPVEAIGAMGAGVSDHDMSHMEMPEHGMSGHDMGTTPMAPAGKP